MKGGYVLKDDFASFVEWFIRAASYRRLHASREDHGR